MNSGTVHAKLVSVGADSTGFWVAVAGYTTGTPIGNLQLRWATATDQWHYCTALILVTNLWTYSQSVHVRDIDPRRRVWLQACAWQTSPDLPADCAPLVLL